MGTPELEAAISLHKAGQLAEAQRCYLAMLKADPNCADAYHLLGVIEMQQLNHGKAKTLIGHAIALRPEVGSFHTNLGVCLTRLAEFESAEKTLQEAIRLSPSSPDALNNLGSLLLEVGRVAESLDLFQRALAASAGRSLDARINYAVAANLGDDGLSLHLLEELYGEYPRVLVEHVGFRWLALRWAMSRFFGRYAPEAFAAELADAALVDRVCDEFRANTHFVHDVSWDLPHRVSDPYAVRLPEGNYFLNRFLSESFPRHGKGGSWQPQAVLFMTNVLKALGYFGLVARVYRHLRRHAGFAEWAWIGIGDLVHLRAIWAQTLIAYDRVGSGGEASPASRRPGGKLSAAGVAYRCASRAAGGADTMARVLMARTAIDVGRHRGAVRELIGVLRSAPDCHTARWLLCDALAFVGREAASRGIFATLREPLLAFSQASKLPLTFAPAVQVGRLVGSLAGRDDLRATPLLAACRQEARYAVIGPGLSFERRVTLSFPEVSLLECADGQSIDNRLLRTPSGDIVWQVQHLGRSEADYFSAVVKSIGAERIVTMLPEQWLQLDGAVPLAPMTGSRDNYYHFLFDVLPTLKLVLGTAGYETTVFVAQGELRAWQQELLALCGIDRRQVVSLPASSVWGAKRMVAATAFSHNLAPHPAAVKLIRDCFASRLAGQSPRPGKRLYLARDPAKEGRRRRVANEDELIAIARDHGFELVYPESLGIAGQIDAFRDAEAICGPGGAAFANLVFAPRGAKAIMLTGQGAVGETYTALASSVGVDAITVMGQGHPRPHRRALWTEFDFAVAPAELLSGLQACRLA